MMTIDDWICWLIQMIIILVIGDIVTAIFNYRKEKQIKSRLDALEKHNLENAPYLEAQKYIFQKRTRDPYPTTQDLDKKECNRGCCP